MVRTYASYVAKQELVPRVGAGRSRGRAKVGARARSHLIAPIKGGESKSVRGRGREVSVEPHVDLVGE